MLYVCTVVIVLDGAVVDGGGGRREGKVDEAG